MKVQHIFTNFVAVDKLNLDHQRIQDYCYKKFETDLRVELNQCWLDFDEAQGPELRPLFEQISDRLFALHKQLQFKTPIELCKAWINLNNSPFTSAPHIHQTAFYSGVYYVKAGPGSGVIEFQSPIAAHPYTVIEGCIEHNNEFNSYLWTEQPEEGKLIIFPSWLTHYVRPNTDNVDRISIAFNARLAHP